MRHAANDHDRFSVTNSLSVEFADFVGGDGDDTLDGTEADDALNGGAGNDVLNGNGGNDRLTGGSGTDSLRGGAGDDDVADYSIEGGAFGVVVNLALDGDGVSHTVPSGPNAGEIVSPGQAIDSFGNRDTIAAIENVLTGNLSDVVYGNGGSNRLESGGGNDFVYGLAGNDELIGGAGDDQLDGGIGDDVMVGDAGSDSYYVTSVGDLITELAGGGNRDTIFVTTAAVAAYSLAGLPEIEQLIGVGVIDNVFTGNAADNVIDGGQGADALAGGTGNDTYFVDNIGDTVTEAAGEGSADEVRTSVGTFTIGANIERLTFIGTGASSLRGNAGDNVITGGSGNDSISLRDGGNDRAVGGAGNDGFYLGAALNGGDAVDGGSGNDQVGMQGNYNVVLGADALINIEVLVFLSSQDDRFGGGSGSSAVLFSYNVTLVDSNISAGATLNVNYNALRPSENVILDGSAETNGKLLVYAGFGDDVLIGGAVSDGFFFGADSRFSAADKLNGGSGADDQLGLRGNYTVVFNDDTITNIETIVFLSGKDTRFGPTGPDYQYNLTTKDANVAAGQRLTATANQLRPGEALTFDGSAELDGTFRLIGGQGNDTLTGGAQADFLYGGLSEDRLTGGGGADQFVYRPASESSSLGFDQIIGFDFREDRIDLLSAVSGFGGRTNVGGLNQASFDSDLQSALSAILSSGQVALFTPDSGDMAGRTFAVVDANGQAGYQPGADYVFELVTPIVPLPSTIEYFI